MSICAASLAMKRLPSTAPSGRAFSTSPSLTYKLPPFSLERELGRFEIVAGLT
jgi:hypothetical protein